jgi:putative SOS response-associated peptidase YedK
MCGRFTLHTEKEALAERFGFDPGDLALLRPRYNVAPTDSVLAVRMRDGERHAQMLRWGLVPYFAKAIDALPLMINARVESVATNAAFRDPLRERRCLIPADGFYEWQAAGPLAKRKVPHWIGLKSGEPFAMAGLWSRWRPKDELGGGEPLYSCTILTAPANETVRALHDRMPLILPREAEARWLDPALDGDVDAILALLRPLPADALEAHPVSTRVNSVKNDDPSLLEPSSEDPQLGFW